HESGNRDDFLELVDAVLALAVAADDRVIEAECRCGKGFDAAYNGRLHRAARHFRTAADLHRSIGREKRARTIELDADLFLLMTGQARHALARQKASLDSFGSESSATLVLVTARQAVTLSYLGEFDAAAATADRALEALQLTDMGGVNLASTIHLIADVQRRCGRWDEALRVVEQTRERLALQGDVNQRIAETLADIYLDLGRPDLAHRPIEAFATAASSARTRERALALRWAYRLATGGAIDAASSVSSALDSENLLLACELMLAAGKAVRPEPSAAQCSVLIGRCEAESLREQLLPLYALRCWLSTLEGDATAAAAGVTETERALDAWPIGAAFPQCTLWLAQALRAAGREAEALIRVDLAAGWIAARAEDAVPPEFRDSFLQRNPTHRALRDWT
ncbi:MAG: hypothetical protein ABI641_05035, partial [Caldimonas sp.]